jgi:aryl-alcohol dehydrogenase-like predicted oxidoreductase
MVNGLVNIFDDLDLHAYVVRLGKSGLKVSKIIMGCMTYGSPEWAKWILDEKTGIEHIKAAYVSQENDV